MGFVASSRIDTTTFLQVLQEWPEIESRQNASIKLILAEGLAENHRKYLKAISVVLTHVDIAHVTSWTATSHMLQENRSKKRVRKRVTE